MSNIILNAVLENSNSRGVDRLVLFVIADRADDSGLAWCGTEDIAKRSGIKRNHVTRHTSALAGIGELEVRPREGKNKSNLYRVRPCPKAGDVPRRDSPKVVQGMSQGGAKPVPRWDINPINPKEPHNDVLVETPSSSPVQEFAVAWNQTGKLPKVLKLTQKRTAAITTRLADQFFRDNWRDALAFIETSAFMTGTNDRGWKADIDWFIRPDSCVKIIEGKYDARKHSPKKQNVPASQYADAWKA